jgi:hypothetical protein
MKRFCHLWVIIAVTLFSSCQKQQTEEERNAEVERQVQQRLAAEHQAEQQQQLAQRQSELDAREKGLADKEAAAAKAPPRQTPFSSTTNRMRSASGDNATASYSTFYTKLEPQGVWRETSTYGYVWQPREAQESRGWRPYTNGHWVYTDAGWTWVSEEPFGWATYHYGRWTRLRNIGWVWVPGDEWAPAWVSWRKSDDYIGWAPLPPEARFDRARGIHNWADSYYDIGPDQYCFVSTNELGAPRIERVILPPERNVTIVNQTTNVTNITYNNTNIVNQGPNYDELHSRTHQPIPRLRLERQINISVENPRSILKGEVIEVPAPVIARAQPVERPRSVKETITQTVVDHGWEAIADRQAAENVRVKIKSEATPPADAPSKTFVRPAQASAETTTSTPLSPSPTLASPTAANEGAAASSPTPSATQSQRAPVAPTQTPMTKFRSPRPLESTTPAPTVSARPGTRDTLPVVPSETISPAPTVTASPTQVGPENPKPTAARRSPTPLGTPLKIATPTPSAAASAPEASATVSVSPSLGATISGPSAQGRDQRVVPKELKKQEKALERQQKKEQHEQGQTRPHETPAGATTPLTPSNSPSAPPSATGSSFLSDARELRKEEKKKEKHQREQAAEPAASVSPSPLATP